MAAHKLALERSGPPPTPDDAVEAARRTAWASADADEGRQAFLEKRAGPLHRQLSSAAQSAAGSSRLTFWKKKYRATTNGTMPTSAPTQLRRTRRLSR